LRSMEPNNVNTSNRSCIINLFFPRHVCLRSLTQGHWHPSALLQCFFLLLLAFVCLTGKGMRVDSQGAKAATADAAAASTVAAQTPTEAEPDRAWLPPQRLANECRDASLGLVQTNAVASRERGYTEEEPEVADREEEVSRKQTVRRLNHTAGNLSDNSASRRMRSVSQLQVSSRIGSIDANHTASFVGSWLNIYVGFQKLNASLLSRERLVLTYVSAESMRTGDVALWLLCATLLVVGILVCVCLREKGVASKASAIRGGDAYRADDPATQQTVPSPPASTAAPSVGQRRGTSRPATRANSLPVSRPPELASTSVLPQRPSNIGETHSFLCPELVVPVGCESILRVPAKKTMNSFHVTDNGGNTFLHVELQSGAINICSCTQNGRFLLAQCVPTSVHGSVDEFHLMHANGEYFAKVVEGGLEELTNWLGEEALMTRKIQTRADVEWFFLVRSDTCAVEVRDNRGKVIALAKLDEETGMTDQPGDADKAYLLQVGPLMDISIVLCGLLVVNQLL